jgi:hypothetical protein
MLAFLALNISLVGVIYFLLAVAVLCILIVGLRWLMAQMGVVIPPPILAILGFMLFLLLLLYALGAFGGAAGVNIHA